MRARRIAICAALLAASCVSPLEQGERLYREGDRQAALRSWESIPQRNAEHGKAHERIEEVKLEQAQLIDRYLRRARYFERHKRLAESLLNYRLALRLQYDEPTMAHVQELARTLVASKKQHWRAFDVAFEAQELAEAQKTLELLEIADPFDTQLTLKKSLLEEALTKRVDAILSRGRRSFSDGAHNKAEAAFNEVLELDPTNETALGLISYIEDIRQTERGTNGKQGRVALSKLDFTKAGVEAEGLYQNAIASEQRNDPYAAIDYDIRALKANPKHEKAKKHLARLRKELTPRLEELVEQGRSAFSDEDLEAALENWNKALLINPDDDRVKGYTERAENLLQELERLRATPVPKVSAQ